MGPLSQPSVERNASGALPEPNGMLCLAWLDRAPDEADRARLALIRLLTRLCHAGDLLGVSVAAPTLRFDGWTRRIGGRRT
jgi:hypothetical protein